MGRRKTREVILEEETVSFANGKWVANQEGLSKNSDAACKVFFYYSAVELSDCPLLLVINCKKISILL